MPSFTGLFPDEITAREIEAHELAGSWINGNRKDVALACAANPNLMAVVVLCLGMRQHGPDLLRYMAARTYTA
jgi:hypothetical protein